MPTNTNLRNAVKLAIAMSTGAFALSHGSTALAQDGADSGDVEEVLVTGSRIPRKDFTSNAPVATIDAGQIEITNTINTESLLNTLPQTVPGLDRTSNNPGNGTATVDLRGLGTNRTLVLIDGTRVVPTSQGGTVDINTIPNALIKDVEVLTGGASAVYGSDAVAGVVNFILKDDFEGAAFNVSHEVTQEGDAALTSADLTLGANFSDDRGNVVFNFSVTDREDLFQGDRDFAFFAQFDSTDANGNPILIDGGSSGIPGTSIFSGPLGVFSPNSFGVTFDQNGNIRPFETAATPNDFYNYAPVNYIQLPQVRYQSTALGSFEATDNVEIYGRAMYTYSQVPQQLAPTPIFQSGTTVTIDGSPFLTALSQQTLSDAHGDGVDSDMDGIDDTATFFVRRRLLEVGPRVSDDTYTSFQVQVGVKGNVTDNWEYDAYVQRGSVVNSSIQLGNVNRDRFMQALRLEGEGTAAVSGTACSDPAANGSTSACAPINIFGEGNISQAGAAFLRTAVAAKAEFEQVTAGLTFAGDLGSMLELPGGRIGAAVGYEHREDDFNFIPSQDLAAGTIAGFNGSPASGGGAQVDGFFGELYLPVLDSLELELAARVEDYTTAGSVSSYKIAGSWSPIDDVRIRAGFNTAVRAPNIGELFQPQAEGFPGSEDPCSGAATDQSAGVAAICTATGVPAGSLFSVALNLAAGQVRQVSGGNPDLKEEEADTFTVGVVVSPSMVEGLTFSLDYFDIKIDDAIASFGGGANNVLNTCYDPNNAFGGIGSEFCNVVQRRADGTIQGVFVTTRNVAEQTLKGFDVIGSYDMDVMGGNLGIRYLGTVTDENAFIAFAGDTPIKCAGKFGLDCGEPVPEYSHRMTANWTRDNWTAQVVWRFVGEVKDDDDATTYFVEKIDAENYFDVQGSYTINDNYRVSFGIDNLFDTDPPLLGDNQEQANTWPATYDVFGRTFFVRGSANF